MKAESSVERELDLFELLHRQRIVMLAIMLLLPANTVQVLSNLSSKRIYETSDADDSYHEEQA